MAHVESSSKGSRRSMNADINLVPFIDFLSICICFLLMTAVYVQVSNLDVKQAFGTAGQASAPPKTELEVKFNSNTEMVTQIKASGKVIKTVSSKIGEWSTFSDQINALKKAYTLDSASITTSSLVTHENFVHVLDELKGQGITSLGVNHGI